MNWITRIFRRLCGRSPHNAATKEDLTIATQILMASIEQNVALLRAENTRLETALQGISADVSHLRALADQAQNGTTSLDQLVAEVRATADRFAALDAAYVPENTDSTDTTDVNGGGDTQIPPTPENPDGLARNLRNQPRRTR